jgi:hypothetical protein
MNPEMETPGACSAISFMTSRQTPAMKLPRLGEPHSIYNLLQQPGETCTQEAEGINENVIEGGHLTFQNGASPSGSRTITVMMGVPCSAARFFHPSIVMHKAEHSLMRATDLLTASL